MKVRILSGAQEDLANGFRFYEAQAEGLGAYFIDSLFSDINSLQFFGGIHQVVTGGYYRMLSKRFPFAVYYLLEDETVLVDAILDCRRSPAWTRKRLLDKDI
jgi:plasmid stabilization system protein ParE